MNEKLEFSKKVIRYLQLTKDVVLIVTEVIVYV